MKEHFSTKYFHLFIKNKQLNIIFYLLFIFHFTEKSRVIRIESQELNFSTLVY